jgi:hypothetical protein
MEEDEFGKKLYLNLMNQDAQLFNRRRHLSQFPSIVKGLGIRPFICK